MRDETRNEIETITGRHELAINTATQRLGILFPEHLVDMRLGPAQTPENGDVPSG